MWECSAKGTSRCPTWRYRLHHSEPAKFAQALRPDLVVAGDTDKWIVGRHRVTAAAAEAAVAGKGRNESETEQAAFDVAVDQR